MRTVECRSVRVFSSVAIVGGSLLVSSGCGDSQPPTGTAAAEAKEAASSIAAQQEFMKKQQGKTGSAMPAAPDASTP